jgi:hypothetical protein
VLGLPNRDVATSRWYWKCCLSCVAAVASLWQLALRSVPALHKLQKACERGMSSGLWRARLANLPWIQLHFSCTVHLPLPVVEWASDKRP